MQEGSGSSNSNNSSSSSSNTNSDDGCDGLNDSSLSRSSSHRAKSKTNGKAKGKAPIHSLRNSSHSHNSNDGCVQPEERDQDKDQHEHEHEQKQKHKQKQSQKAASLSLTHVLPAESLELVMLCGFWLWLWLWLSLERTNGFVWLAAIQIQIQIHLPIAALADFHPVAFILLSDVADDAASLKTASMVCRLFYLVSQRFIYRNPYISGTFNWAQFLIRLQSSRNLGTCIQALDLGSSESYKIGIEIRPRFTTIADLQLCVAVGEKPRLSMFSTDAVLSSTLAKNHKQSKRDLAPQLSVASALARLIEAVGYSQLSMYLYLNFGHPHGWLDSAIIDGHTCPPLLESLVDALESEDDDHLLALSDDYAQMLGDIVGSIGSHDTSNAGHTNRLPPGIRNRSASSRNVGADLAYRASSLLSRTIGRTPSSLSAAAEYHLRSSLILELSDLSTLRAASSVSTSASDPDPAATRDQDDGDNFLLEEDGLDAQLFADEALSDPSGSSSSSAASTSASSASASTSTAASTSNSPAFEHLRSRLPGTPHPSQRPSRSRLPELDNIRQFLPSVLRMASSPRLRRLLSSLDFHSVNTLNPNCRASISLSAGSLHQVFTMGRNLQWLSLARSRVIPDTYIVELDAYVSQMSFTPADYFTRIRLDYDVIIHTLASSCPRLAFLDVSGCDWFTRAHLKTLLTHSPCLRAINLLSCTLVPRELQMLHYFSFNHELVNKILSKL